MGDEQQHGIEFLNRGFAPVIGARFDGIPDAGLPIGPSLTIVDTPKQAETLAAELGATLDWSQMQDWSPPEPDLPWAVTRVMSCVVEHEERNPESSLAKDADSAAFTKECWYSADFRVLEHACWLLKDTGAHVADSWVVSSAQGQTFHRRSRPRRPLSDSHCAEGWPGDPTPFSKEDTKLLAAFAVSELEGDVILGAIPLSLGEEQPRTIHTRNMSRVVRFFDFLDRARSSDDVGVRLALYATCLECLFATSSSELSSALAHRTAIFTADTLDERMNVAKRMKKTYDIRSKIIHGEGTDLKNLQESATWLDGILRLCIRKVLSHRDWRDLFASGDHEQSRARIQQYFEAELLSPGGILP